MALGNRMWGAGKVVVLVAALGMTFIVFAFGSMRIALRAREVTVPDLRDRTVAEATAQLATLGLTLRVDDSRRLDPKVPADRVLLQDPAGGAITRRQRSIRVWLSAGPRIATIPQLTGEMERTAQLRLQADGLAIVGVFEIRSNDYMAGAVVAQRPPPESRGTEVALLVNRGERSTSYVMPDLIGVNGDRAAELLRSRGLRVAVVGEQPYPGVPAGIVLRQLPQAGFQIAPGEPISIEVSR
jgi:serine/threonine-protein kinase